jgi:hypothetical protein
MKRFVVCAALFAAATFSTGCATSYGQKEEAVRETSRQGAGHKLARPGFVVFDADDEGRLWIFRSEAKELAEYSKSKELAKFVSAIGEGPGGVTVKAPDMETIRDYMKNFPNG